MIEQRERQTGSAQRLYAAVLVDGVKCMFICLYLYQSLEQFRYT